LANLIKNSLINAIEAYDPQVCPYKEVKLKNTENGQIVDNNNQMLKIVYSPEDF
jgi:hypothetical protein